MSKIIKKHGKTALVLGLILVLIGYYFLIPTTQAASIANRKLTVTDSRPSTTSVRYTFTGDHSATVVKCLYAQLCTAATGTCTLPTGMSLSVAAATSTGWNGWTYANGWTFATSATGFKYTYATGQAGGASYAFSASGITNPSGGATYYAVVNTYTNTDCTTGSTDNGTAAFAIVSGVTVTATVAETLTFTVGTTSLDFGVIDGTNIRYASGTTTGSNTEPAAGSPSLLTLATNAAGGATVTIQDVGSGSAAGLWKSTATTHLIAATTPTSVSGTTESYAPYEKSAGANLTTVAGFLTGGTTIVTTSPVTFFTAAAPLSTLNTIDLALKAGITAATPGGSYTDTIILIATPTY